MDDATSEIYSAFLVEEEGTVSTFRALREVIGEHGLFCALYTDRGSHYFRTAKAGEKVSKTQQTQVGRALAHLGIEHRRGSGACRDGATGFRSNKETAPNGCTFRAGVA